MLDAVGRVLGSILDADDRRALCQLAILVLVVALALILLAAAGGVAVAVFEEMRSISG